MSAGRAFCMLILFDQMSWGPLTGVFVVLGITLGTSILVLGALLLYSFWSDHR